MLLRSLSAELYKNGRRVSEYENGSLDDFKNINEDDSETGFIYILKSLSNDPKIQSIPNLCKIGYSSIPVEERIKNAELEPTYLMAPVKIVSTIKCYNLNPQKFEQLIHNFFGKTCLNFDIFDINGKRHTPREWFIAPLDSIEEAIEFIISGEIVDYRYDTERQIIVGK
ncbi:MAG TPA: GIY-YIG nuclease family protein [Paludibacter sp.]